MINDRQFAIVKISVGPPDFLLDYIIPNKQSDLIEEYRNEKSNRDTNLDVVI